MAYVYTTNLTPATGSVAMYNLKETLKNAGWTVMSSSDGTTYNASGDQITTGSSGAGGMANVNAWFRIQMPTAQSVNREFVFQRTTDNTLWRIKYSYSAGFVGGSPSATRVPSATDEGVAHGGGTDASPTGSKLFNTDGGYRWSCAAGDASENYTWWSSAFPIGGGNVSHAMFWDVLLTGTYPAADIEPYCFHSSGGALGDGVLTQTDFSGTNWFSIAVMTWYKKGLSGQSYTQLTGAHFAEGAATSRSLSIVSQLGSNPNNGKDDLIPIPIGRRLTFGAQGFKGILSMVKYIGVDRVTSDTLNVVSTRDRIIIRPISLPWDGSVPVV